MPHPRNAGWRRGDHWICCDVCGFDYRASQIRIRWDGMAVCPQDYEERHPQDFLRARKDDPRVWPVRTCDAVSGLVCPVPIAPRNNETIHNATSANLQWNTVAGITSYQVFVWASSGSAPASPTATVTITDGSTIGSYFATGLSSDTAYSWYVNSVFDGVAAENCRTDYGRSFTTATAVATDVVWDINNQSVTPEDDEFTISVDELQVTVSLTPPGLNDGQIHATQSRATGKRYFEVEYLVPTLGSGISNTQWTAGLSADAPSTFSVDFGVDPGLSSQGGSQGGISAPAATTYAFTYDLADGDIIGIAWDADTGNIWVSVNGSFNLSAITSPALSAGANPATGANPIYTDITGTMFPTLLYLGDSSGGFGYDRGFRARFASADWTYAAPSGFTEWGA